MRTSFARPRPVLAAVALPVRRSGPGAVAAALLLVPLADLARCAALALLRPALAGALPGATAVATETAALADPVLGRGWRGRRQGRGAAPPPGRAREAEPGRPPPRPWIGERG